MTYADQTAAAWEREEAKRAKSEERDEYLRAWWHGQPHRYEADSLIPGFCRKCAYAKRMHL